MKNIEMISVFGEPSIDTIIELDQSALWNMALQEGHWKLDANSYFVFADKDQETLGRLFIGKKWGDEDLPLDVKETIFSHETGLYIDEPFDTVSHSTYVGDKNSIIGTMLGNQMGGPVRNTLNALVEITNGLETSFGADFSGLFLGGFDQGTDEFRQHMAWLNEKYSAGSIDFKFLRDENWATHRAFNFIPPHGGKACQDGDFRTLIRWQEMRKSFSSETIDDYFSTSRDRFLGSDAVYINSLKALGVIENVSELLQDYEGEVIVAPTNNMMQVAWDQTYKMLERADRVILNMGEACEITDSLYKPDMPISTKGKIAAKLLSIGPRPGKRVYISDDGYHPVGGEVLDDGSIDAYVIQPFEVCELNHINAGDNFTGAVLLFDLQGGNGQRVLAQASAYASYRVSLKDGSSPIKGDDLLRFAAQYGCRDCHQYNMKKETIDTTNLFTP